MKNKYKGTFIILLVIDVILLAVFLVTILIGGHNIAVLNPMGYIAHRERDLMITSVLLMLVVVLPVFILTFIVATKYRVGNTNAHYTPEWNHSKKWQLLLWVFPSIIVLILSIINWKITHQLDPHQPIISNKKPIVIQVIALQWKWLFIYPKQKLATVNYVAFPEQTPITFELTSDAPMNSFWIPNLGGQIYTMPGMVTPLHLIADTAGVYPGSTAEMSGPGFAGMRFTAKSLTQEAFDIWIASVKQSPRTLSLDEYNKLAKPSEDNPKAYYSWTEENLFNTIIMKFITPHSMDSHATGTSYPNGTPTKSMPNMQM